jgi:hypothetical protein
MRKRKIAKVKVFEIWIEPIQHTFARKVRGNLRSRTTAIKVKNRLQQANPGRRFMVFMDFKTLKQIRAQRAFAKAMQNVKNSS